VWQKIVESLKEIQIAAFLTNSPQNKQTNKPKLKQGEHLIKDQS